MPEPKRLYQKVGAQLKALLASGQYTVGSRLPPERDIAEQLGVSRVVIREALVMLEVEEILEVRRGSGVYVTRLPDSGNDRQAVKTPTAEDDVGPFEMLQARQLLESQVAAFAATQVNKSDIAEMRQVLAQERHALEAGLTDYDADEKFHTLIARATQNALLEEMVNALWLRRQSSPMWQKLHTHIVGQSYRRQWLEDHHGILMALQQRDPKKARQAMWQHLENVKQTLLVLSDSDDPEFDGYLFSSIPAVITE